MALPISAPLIPPMAAPIAAPMAAPLNAALIGPDTRNGAHRGPNVPMPAGQPSAPPSTPPALAHAVAISGAFVRSLHAKSFAPFPGGTTQTWFLEKPAALSLVTIAIAWSQVDTMHITECFAMTISGSRSATGT